METHDSGAGGEERRHFIQQAIDEDLASGRFRKVRTRFPPEPNGYLHIGHAKAICLSFGMAAEYGGTCNLRFDDTNPTKEEVEFVDSIQEDIRWLGFDWEDRLYFASDYFPRLYEFAEDLIKKGKAFVCDQTLEEMRVARGTITEPGVNSPFRDRSVEENLDLFRRMRAGEFPEGSRTLRAKIDMAHPNLLLRDPVMYRILHARHHRTGDAWRIYPTYDFAHGQSDSLEEISHSLCSLEFETHRPLYEWYIQSLGIFPSRQIEFARLAITHTVLSKRKLRALVEDGTLMGWDDPRMPTLRGFRRRGYSAEAIRDFVDRVGMAKRNSLVEHQLLEHVLREHLNKTSARRMGVLDPIKLVVENLPAGRVEWFDAVNNPEDPAAGARKVPFTREIWIERDDFREVPPPKYHRLSPGKEVRLRYACLVKCTGVTKDAEGAVTEVRCEWDPESRGGSAPDGRKVKSTIHWVSAEQAVDAEVRVFDHLFTPEDPNDVDDDDWRAAVNPASMEVVTGCKMEPALADAAPGERLQLERLGYYCVDPDSAPGKLVLNRTVTLRDTWAKIEQRGG